MLFITQPAKLSAKTQHTYQSGIPLLAHYQNILENRENLLLDYGGNNNYG